MKFLTVLTFASVALARYNVFDRRNCAGNNCNREITGTRDGLPASTLRKADCTSYLLTIVTPAATTTTTWVEPPTTSAAAKRDEPAAIFGRDATAVTVVPSALPTYATMCTKEGAYASACECWGVTASVSTAPVPTVTVTSTYDYCDDL